jgi:hypothetical protein
LTFINLKFKKNLNLSATLFYNLIMQDLRFDEKELLKDFDSLNESF